MDIKHKVVIVKHPNCGVPYTFRVPVVAELEAGDYVLCETKTSKIPQIARCITPSFWISDAQLKELHGIDPNALKPVVGILEPVMFPYKAGENSDKN